MPINKGEDKVEVVLEMQLLCYILCVTGSSNKNSLLLFFPQKEGGSHSGSFAWAL